MNESKRTRIKNVSDETKVKNALNFIEELSWLLESKRQLRLSEIPEILREQLQTSDSVLGAANKYASPNPNIHYLIGVLPRLFQDTKLFPRNEDIAMFAKDVLEIEISRVVKRSKYELIGMVVCECNDLDDSKLDELVSALAEITGNAEKIKLMAKEKMTTGFSWNETIRKLAK